MAKKNEKLVCVASRGGAGWYSVIDGAGTLVERSLSDLRAKAQEIAAQRGMPLHFEAELPEAAMIAVQDAIAARAISANHQARAQELLREAVGQLVLAGLSTREAEVLLDISHSSVKTLFEELRLQRIAGYTDALKEKNLTAEQRREYTRALKEWQKPPAKMRENLEALLAFDRARMT